MELPGALSWWRDVPGGAEWLERLPRLAADCAEQWGLELGTPLAGGNVSFVVPAGDAVLKLNFPDEESEHEADALPSGTATARFGCSPTIPSAVRC